MLNMPKHTVGSKNQEQMLRRSIIKPVKRFYLPPDDFQQRYQKHVNIVTPLSVHSEVPLTSAVTSQYEYINILITNNNTVECFAPPSHCSYQSLRHGFVHRTSIQLQHEEHLITRSTL